MKYINPRTRIKQPSRLKRHLKLWKLYISIAIIAGVIGYIVLLGTMQFAKQLFRLTAEAPTHKVYAKEIEKPIAPTSKDVRVQKVHTYLVSKNSPLANHSEYIVEQADKNDIPWTLIVAISGKESSFGKAIQENSNNAWGIMSWDSAGKSSIRMFNAWEDSIQFEAELLGKSFKKDMIAGIQRRYCPSFECSTTWTDDIAGFSEAVNK